MTLAWPLACMTSRFQTLVLAGTFVALVAHAADSQGGVLANWPLFEPASAWDGFTGGYLPAWSGQERRINWSRSSGVNGPGGSGSILTIAGNPNYEIDSAHYQPVRLISASRDASIDTSAYVSAGGQSQSASYDPDVAWQEELRFHRNLAGYARVIDLDDLTVGEANAIATTESMLSDGLFAATHRVSSFGSVDPLVYGSAVSSASVTTTAIYEVSEMIEFTLQGRLNGEANAAGGFTLTELDTGRQLFRYSIPTFTNQGGKQFSWNGRITRGSYKLEFFSTAAESEVRKDRVQSAGGTGEFHVSFGFHPNDPADFNSDGRQDAGDLQVWSQNFGATMPGDLDGDLQVRANDRQAWLDAGNTGDFYDVVNEPRPADANFDLATNGADFLIWQRQYKPSAQVSTAAVAVPEPRSSLMIVLAFVVALSTRAGRLGAPVADARIDKSLSPAP